MSVNTVSLSGNLVADAEVRPTNGGKEMLLFRVAVTESVPDGEGNWVRRPSFFNCVKFGNVRGVAPYLSKGTYVAVCGRLREQRWEKDGKRRSAVEVIVSPQGLDFVTRDRPKDKVAPVEGPEGAQGADPGAYDPDDGLYDEDVVF